MAATLSITEKLSESHRTGAFERSHLPEDDWDRQEKKFGGAAGNRGIRAGQVLDLLPGLWDQGRNSNKDPQTVYLNI